MQEVTGQERGSSARLALAGLASPAVLLTTVLLVAGQRPEYSHARQTISELGTAGRLNAVWMNWAGIIPAGVLLIVAAVPLSRAFGRSTLGMTAGSTLALAGAAFVVAGAFPWVGGPGDLLSSSSRIHLVAAVTGFIGLAVAPVLFGLQARRTAARWFRPSLVAGTAVFLLAFWPAQGDAGGLFQRASLVTFYSWLIAASIRTLRGPSL